jgi:hypothetical protein
VEVIASLRHPDWQTVDEARTHAALDYYNEALAAAPGHCGAIFGRGLAQAVLLIQDKGVNQAVASAVSDGQGSRPLAKAYKASRDEAAPLVLRVAAGLQTAGQKPFIEREQDRIATEILPGLDSVIASLDAVMTKENFSVDFPRNDGTYLQVDAGDIGPVVGGLKVVKAVILVICGYQWEVAQNGSYAWMDRLETINRSDYKHLAPRQKETLDHLTGLFQVGNAFTRAKPAWKPLIGNIPDLLLEAVNSTEAGLRYAKSEAAIPGSQDHDIYRVGTGEDADIDPAEIDSLIDALERTKKYLNGEVTIEYHRVDDGRATHSLRMNFRKVFQWDGLQNFLPYFTVRPYDQWVTPLPVDTANPHETWLPEWSSSPEAGVSLNRILQALDLPGNANIRMRAGPATGGYQLMLTHDEDEWFATYHGPDVVMATLAPQSGHACIFDYVQEMTRYRVRPSPIFPSDGDFTEEELNRSGTLSLGDACYEEAGGGRYRQADEPGLLRPFYFTDASGNKTLEVNEADQAVDRMGLSGALTGKVVFRDPTFGGVFPDLNNDNIWSKIESLQGTQGPRLDEVCETDPYGEPRCRKALPSNPSDLDVWSYHLMWLDELL